MTNFSSKNYILDLIRKFPEMLEKKKLIVFLIDGLGLSNLKLPFLKKSIYQTIFPSTTPNFLYSFHSLLEPKDHGFLEWFMRFENLKLPITIPPWKSFDGEQLKVKKRVVFPFESLSEILWKRGFSCFYYTPFANSVFTQAVSKKARVKNITYLSQIFPLPQADFILIYWPSSDEILHKEFLGESFEIDKKILEFFIKILYQKMPKGSRLIIFSDHGLTRIKKRYKLPIIDTYPVGGGRVTFYKSNKKKVEEELKKRKIPALIYELKELKFFQGKINKRCVENFGNIIAIAKEYIGFNYPFEKHPKKLIGRHGGLSKEEMFVNVWIGEK